MYRLIRYSGVNLIGFASGLGKKKVDLDLSDYLDREVICICGDNGTGKSTLASTIHPWPWPTDGRNKFICEGKEGVIVREYRGDDGTEILTRCIYKPKKTNGEYDGHSCQAYFSVKVPGTEDFVEMNANGNVTSYKQLLHSYFGITKDFLSFASYNNAVNSIVRMTDTERKDSVNMLIPNVKRFEVAYDVVNDKYKELRNMIRNLSQKILSLRDEDLLESELDRLTDDFQKYTEERETCIKKLAKYKGRLEELSGGQDLDELIGRYNAMVSSLAVYDTQIGQVQRSLFDLYQELGIEPEKEGSVVFSDMDKVPAQILKYERKLASIEADMSNRSSRRDALRQEAEAADKEISEVQSMLYSVNMQDPKELERTKLTYERQLSELRYTKRIEEFEGMTYDEAVALSRQVVMVDQMIEALYVEYGDLVSQYFSSDMDTDSFEARINEQGAQLMATIQTTSAKRDQLYRQMVEKEQYKHLQEALKLRPRNCTINDCPFIANALKYAGVAAEVAELSKRYEEMGILLESQVQTQKQLEQSLAMQADASKLVQYLVAMEDQLRTYLHIDSLKSLYRAIGNGTWRNLLDIQALKETASVLSEKELYYQIVNIRLPEVEHALELARVHSTNRDILEHQLAQATRRRNECDAELSELGMHLTIGQKQQERYRRMKDRWTAVSENLERYRELIRNQLETQNQVSDQDSRIQTIKDLADRIREKKGIIDELDGMIQKISPMREQVKLDLDAVRRLKIEQAEVERNFVVIDIIRRIVSPGKGIRKELLSIYMDDIRETANHLLSHTMGGRLILEEFIITDKEFVIPYTYSGEYGSDVCYASSAQQAMISTAMSLAILSRLLTKYNALTLDEVDAPLSPKNKGEFIPVLIEQMKFIGINQTFLVTQSGERYRPFDPLYILFPGAETTGNGDNTIEID